MSESSVIKKAYDRWQGGREQPAPAIDRGEDTPLGAVLGLPPEAVEEFATLASRIELSLTGASRRAIVVASPTRSTGSTTVAVGLAATLATSAKVPVLLADANLRHPALHAKFEIDQEPGLTDLVRGRATAEQVLRRTAVDRLTLVTSGAEEPAPQGFFQTAEFRELLGHWTSQFAYVILDSAPFGVVSEPLNLAQNASGVVLVVEAARTVREVAADMVEDLRTSGVRILGAVLNRRKFYVPDWIYRRI